MSTNIGTLKANEDGIHIGRIATLGFSALIALREVNSNSERAPAYDVMGLSPDRRTWVKVGALWEYTATGSGEVFLSGRLDDHTMERPLDVALFRQQDGSYNVSWRRPQTRRAAPALGNEALPPMPPAGTDEPVDGTGEPVGDGLGDSTAPAPSSRRKAAAPKEDVPA